MAACLKRAAPKRAKLGRMKRAGRALETARVAAIHKRASLKAHEQPDRQSPGPRPVLNACRVRHHGQQLSHHVFDLFVCAISAPHPFETVLTDWKLRIATLSLARLPVLAQATHSPCRTDASRQRRCRSIFRNGGFSEQAGPLAPCRRPALLRRENGAKRKPGGPGWLRRHAFARLADPP